MTATYSKERPAPAEPFHLHAAANAGVYAAESDVWKSAEGKLLHREYLEAPWTTPEVSRNESGAALDIADRADINQKPVEFAQPCEEEFARMLDARDISWQYKPRTFAVEWDEEGNFVDCFTPDFYLPANEMYIAVVAPAGNESGAKTHKVTLLRRQHPEIRIEILRSHIAAII